MCDDFSFINTRQKTLKPSKKMFQCLGWMRKNFIPGDFSWRVALKYIKLVVPKILFILALYSFNFYYKVVWPPPPTKLPHYPPPPHHQNKNFWPPSKEFSEISGSIERDQWHEMGTGEKSLHQNLCNLAIPDCNDVPFSPKILRSLLSTLFTSVKLLKISL